MWTADKKSNEEWSSQLWSQFLQLHKEAWKKNQYFNFNFNVNENQSLDCNQYNNQ